MRQARSCVSLPASSFLFIPPRSLLAFVEKFRIMSRNHSKFLFRIWHFCYVELYLQKRNEFDHESQSQTRWWKLTQENTRTATNPFMSNFLEEAKRLLFEPHGSLMLLGLLSLSTCCWWWCCCCCCWRLSWRWRARAISRSLSSSVNGSSST